MKAYIINTICIIAALSISWQVDLFAAEIEVAPNTTIGMGPIDYQNCSKEIQDIINKLRINIYGQLSKSLVLKVVPLEDMDKTIAMVIRSNDESLASWALRVGKQAGVDKIVFATISENEKKYVTDKTSRFKVTVYVLDLKTETLEIVQPADAELVDDVYQIFINAGDTIARIYHGHSEITEKTEGSVTLSYLYPQADLRNRGAGNGYGISINAYFTVPVWFLLTGGVFYFDTTRPNIDALYMLPVGVHIPFYCAVSDNFKIIPSIGAGGLISLMWTDKYNYRPSGDYHYKLGFFFNPMLTARLEMNYNVLSRYALIATPSFSYIFGKQGRRGFVYSMDIGFKVQF